VAEACDAAGNNGPCAPGADGVVYCVGTTGAIFQNTEYSTPRRIVTGLSSIRTTNNATVLGVHDMDLFLGQLNLVFGLSGDQPFRDALGPQGAQLGRTATVNWFGFGNVTLEGDLVAFEQANNPEPFVIDSDPYGMVRDFGGTVVADAAGNDIVRVKNNGDVELMAVIPNRGSQTGMPRSSRNGSRMPMVGSCEQAMNSDFESGVTVFIAKSYTSSSVTWPSSSTVAHSQLRSTSTAMPAAAR
jgi:hypothetical protein